MTAPTPSSSQPEVMVSSKAQAASNFTLDSALTVGVLNKFTLDSDRPKLTSNQVIIGTLCDREATTTKIEGITYHTLPVLPYTDPEFIDWEKPPEETNQDNLNYRTTQLLFNIATHGSVEEPEKPIHDTGRKSSLELSIYLRNSIIYAVGAVAAEFFWRRGAHIRERAIDLQHRRIEETATYQKIIIKKSDSHLQPH